MPETPLLSYLRIQRAVDRDILNALRQSAVAIDGELRRLQAKSGAGAALRKEQLLRSKSVINKEVASLFDKVGKTTEAGAARAAQAGAESILRESRGVLEKALSKADYDYLLRSSQESASKSMEALQQRVSGSSYVPLSEKVYGSQNLVSGQIDNIVNTALSTGASAAELAKNVRDYINPNTPGGARYASMRLGRTEINNAFHAAQVKEAQDSPWVDALQWHLSGSHPKPDACNTYADHEPFKPKEVPAKPHPQCLCYTTPVTPTREEFIDAFMKGDYDKHLDDMGLEAPVVEDAKAIVKAPVPKVPAPEKPVPVPRFRTSPLTEDDMLTLDDYVNNGSFDGINAGLRGVETNPEFKAFSSGDLDMGWVNQEAAALDKAIAKSTTKSEITVYRGVDADAIKVLKPGAQFTDNGFMSTSLDPKIADGFGDTIMKVTYPAARPALYIDSLESLSLGQAEVLLPRGLTMGVKSVRTVNGKTVIHVTVEELKAKAVAVKSTDKFAVSQAKSHLGSKVLKPGVDKRVTAEMQRQVELAPNSVRSLQGVSKMTPQQSTRQGAGVMGYQERGSIYFKDTILKPAFQKSFQKDVDSGWFVKGGDGVSHTIAHEFGHQMDEVMRMAGATDRGALLDFVGKELGMSPRTPGASGYGNPKQQKDSLSWTLRNSHILRTKISKYGATNELEMLAEIWAEYSTSPSPRPHILAIGKRMQTLSEATAKKRVR